MKKIPREGGSPDFRIPDQTPRDPNMYITGFIEFYLYYGVYWERKKYDGFRFWN